MMNKICPKCKRGYSELEHYCTKCGMQLEKEPNVCSEKRLQCVNIVSLLKMTPTVLIAVL